MTRPGALFPILIAALALSSAPPAQAGAWAREEGTLFLSFAFVAPVEGDATQDGTGSIYAEYGLPWRLTAGAKIDQRSRGPQAVDLFLRRTLTAASARLQFAVEIGMELAVDTHTDAATGRLSFSAETGQALLALHAGRGFDSRYGSGWIDTRIGAKLPSGDADLVGEVDATLGLRLGARLFSTMEVWHTFDAADTTTTLVPGLGYRLTERITVTSRYRHDLRGGGADRVELGAWVDF